MSPAPLSSSLSNGTLCTVVSMWIMSMTCMGAWLGGRGLTYGGEGVQQDQQERRRALLPPFLSLRHGRLRKCRAEGMHSSAAVRAMRTGPKGGSAACPWPVPVDSGHDPCPWTGGAWREPSRRVCSFFRKSKLFKGAMLIWRCNTSGRLERLCAPPARGERGWSGWTVDGWSDLVSESAAVWSLQSAADRLFLRFVGKPRLWYQARVKHVCAAAG